MQCRPPVWGSRAKWSRNPEGPRPARRRPFALALAKQEGYFKKNSPKHFVQPCEPRFHLIPRPRGENGGNSQRMVQSMATAVKIRKAPYRKLWFRKRNG